MQSKKKKNCFASKMISFKPQYSFSICYDNVRTVEWANWYIFTVQLIWIEKLSVILKFWLFWESELNWGENKIKNLNEVFIFRNKKKKMCKNHCVNACSSWQLWIKPILILLYILFVICVVPWLVVETVKDGFTKEDQLIWLGGLFVLTAIPLCIWHIVQHMLHFTKPILQKVRLFPFNKSITAYIKIWTTHIFLADNSHTLDGAYLCRKCCKWLDQKIIYYYLHMFVPNFAVGRFNISRTFILYE